MNCPSPRVLGDVHERAVDRERQARSRGGIGVHVAERHGARLHRVVVPVHEQLLHRRADVADAGAEAAGQLALEREVVLIDVRQLQVQLQSLIAEAERLAPRAGRKALLQLRPGESDRVAERVARHDVARALGGARRMEDAESAPKHGLVAVVEALSEAEARADVVPVGLDQPAADVELVRRERAGQLLGARRQQRADRGVRHDVMPAVGRDEVRVDVVSVDEDADHLIPQPQEQRQPGIQLEVVLREHGPVVRERVHRQVAAGIALLAHFVGQTEQEVRERVARRKPREGVRAFRFVRAGGVAVLRVVARVDAAELDRVRALQPGRAAAEREGRLIEIAERVLPLVANVGRPVRAGKQERREAGDLGGQRRHLEPQLSAQVAGDEMAASIARVRAVAAAEFVDERAGPDPGPSGGERGRLRLAVEQAEIRQPGAAVAARALEREGVRDRAAAS